MSQRTFAHRSRFFSVRSAIFALTGCHYCHSLKRKGQGRTTIKWLESWKLCTAWLMRWTLQTSPTKTNNRLTLCSWRRNKRKTQQQRTSTQIALKSCKNFRKLLEKVKFSSKSNQTSFPCLVILHQIDPSTYRAPRISANSQQIKSQKTKMKTRWWPILATPTPGLRVMVSLGTRQNIDAPIERALLWRLEAIIRRSQSL